MSIESVPFTRGRRVLPLVLGLAFLVPAIAAAPNPTRETIPGSWLAGVRQRIEQEEYEATWQPATLLRDLDAAWHAPNRAHNFRTYFTTQGIRVIPRTEVDPAWEWGLTFVEYGREGREHRTAAAGPRTDRNRVEYDRGAVLEWYENSPRGLEQGFTLLERPEGGDEPVRVVLALSGTLAPVLHEGAQGIDFVTPSGVRAVRYAELKVTDAGGAILKARMEGFSGHSARGIRIVVDDRHGVYPLTIDPLATSPAWAAESDQAGALFGSAVATAGDVNGDGYSDVIVGAFHFDNGQSNEGRAYVYLGSASGPSSTPAWTAESDQASAEFGISVATAGDVNGDGYSDVIVGARYYDHGETDEGRAYVYLGSPAGLAGTAAWTAEPDRASAMFGVSVSTAGDVNGDGYSDVIVGARLYFNYHIQEGAAFVYLGSASGLAASPAWTAESDQPYALFGCSVAAAGDVNGDGYSDVIVGAYGYDNGETDEGRAYVYLGSPSGLATSAAWTAECNQDNAHFGWSVSGAGDVDGDGYADVIVGARDYDNPEVDEGRVFVYHGSSGGLFQHASWTCDGGQGGANFGWAVATAGDVNGDGYADVIAGSPYVDSGDVDEGRAYLWFGSSSGLSTEAGWVAEGDQTGANLGMALATAGDVNGDGYADVIVSARGYDGGQTDEGRAYVFLGSAASLGGSPGWTAYGDQDAGHFGWAAATAGDVNGDGYADVIVGAPRYDNGETEEGRAYLFLGLSSGLSASPAWTAEGNASYATFGRSVATAGDVNGDGYADVIVGAPSFYDLEHPLYGKAYVYLGSALGLATSAAWIHSDSEEGLAWFGSSVSTAGDVDGDGYADVIVGGSVLAHACCYEARAYVFRGSTAGLEQVPSWTTNADDPLAGAENGWAVVTAGDVDGDGYSDVIVGCPTYSAERGLLKYCRGSAWGIRNCSYWLNHAGVHARFGFSVSTAGDVNGDGYSDVVVGAPGYDNGQTDEGGVYLFLGSAVQLSAFGWIGEGEQDGALFGSVVGSAGDVNGDGYSDVIVGAPGLDISFKTDAGRVYLYHGSAAGLGSSPAWTADGNQGGLAFGTAAATAGDVNGDGYSDVVVGGPYDDAAQPNAGGAMLYYGNGGRGLSFRPEQRRADDAGPIGVLGHSDGASSFRLAMVGRTPFGRGKVKAAWEAKPLGVPFDGAGVYEQPVWSDTRAGSGGALLNNTVTMLDSGVPYHWRLRVRYDPVTVPFQSRGRWFTGWWNGPEEMDLRTRWLTDAAVTVSDTPDPVIVGGPDLTDTIEVRNDGPGGTLVRLEQLLPDDTSLLSATPDQGSCTPSGSTLSCDLGWIDYGGVATVLVRLRPLAEGTLSTTVTLEMPRASTDPDPTDNSAVEQTQAVRPGAGDRIWLDSDGDGIQDEGEPGLAGATVAAYESATGSPVDGAVSDGSGSYRLTGLAYGGTYYLVFFPPLGYVLTDADQGGDDGLDSDPDPVTWRTPAFTFLAVEELARWDAGMLPACVEPDEAIYLYMVTRSGDGNDYPILHFMDPNQTSQVTGYNVYRSGDASLPRSSWPLIASDVVDMDEGTANKQWVDTSGDPPPGGIWYYSVTAYNHRCPAEGPW